MADRCVVNVGVGRWYPAGQQRLRKSLATDGRAAGAELLFWGGWPDGAPPHHILPFAFKSAALAEARRAGYRTLLWLDCSCWAVRSLEPLFAEIEARGYVFMANGFWIGQWASDYCLDRFGVSRDRAMEFRDLDAKLMGICLDDPRAAAWLDGFIDLCRDPRLMHGSLHNVPGQEIVDPHSGYNCGVISADPRCRGHAREQTVAGLLAHNCGLAPFTLPPRWLQGLPPDQQPDPAAVVQACGL